MHVFLRSIALWSAASFVASCSTSSFNDNQQGRGKKAQLDNNGDPQSDDGIRNPNDPTVQDPTNPGIGGSDGNGLGSGGDSTGIDGDGNITDDSSNLGLVTEDFNADESVEKLVDVVFVIDASKSVKKGEKGRLQSLIPSFIARFLAEKKDVDYQMFIVGHRWVEDLGKSLASDSKIHYIKKEVLSINSLKHTISFMKSNSQLRANADIEFVFISDDNAQYEGKSFQDDGVDAQAFRMYLQSRPELKNVHVNGIVGFNKGDFGDCEIDRVGTSYISLANSPEYQGVLTDFCNGDWQGLFDQLGSVITSRAVRKSFKLEKPVDEAKDITVTVAGITKQEGTDYNYDAGENKVTFLDGKEPEAGALVQVSYWKE